MSSFPPLIAPARPARSPGPAALVLVSLAAGLAYPAIVGRFGAAIDVIAKGSAVLPLAIAALLLPVRGARWLAAIMAAGAIGDMLLALPGGFIAGGAAFAAGHALATALYWRHRRPRPGLADRIAAFALVGWGVAMPALLLPPQAPHAGLAVYAVLLCVMAATALGSDFPRRLGIGALLFVASDSLLVMRLGGHLVGGADVHGLLVWYSYYAGQLLIFAGVAAGLVRRTP